jgi:hypothetical protein
MWNQTEYRFHIKYINNVKYKPNKLMCDRENIVTRHSYNYRQKKQSDTDNKANHNKINTGNNSKQMSNNGVTLKLL